MSSWPNLSLTNIHDGTFNNLFIIYDNNAVNIFDLFAFKKDIIDITGLPPNTLNTLQEMAQAINNDPNFFEYIRSQLALKRNITDSYERII